MIYLSNTTDAQNITIRKTIRINPCSSDGGKTTVENKIFRFTLLDGQTELDAEYFSAYTENDELVLPTEKTTTGWTYPENIASVRVCDPSSIGYSFQNAKTLSGFDNSVKVKGRFALSNCNATTLDLRTFDISECTGSTSSEGAQNIEIFSCMNLKEVDVTGWNFEKQLSINSLFSRCYSLEVIKGFETWNLPNVTSTPYAFYYCQSLKELDLSGWKIKNLNYWTGMFNNCRSLVTLNLDGWQSLGTSNGNSVFGGCSSLKTIYARGCNERMIQDINVGLAKYSLLSQVTVVTE